VSDAVLADAQALSFRLAGIADSHEDVALAPTDAVALSFRLPGFFAAEKCMPYRYLRIISKWS
jgi:hypothetical protein